MTEIANSGTEPKQDLEGDPQGGEPKDQEPDWKAEAEKWKSLSRQNEARAKENAEKAKRLDEVEESKKTELQKAKEAREAAERQLQQFQSQREVETARTELSKEYGVPAEALRGTSREELEDHAKILQPLFKKPNGPSTDGQGRVGDVIEVDKTPTPNELLRAARGL